MNVVSRFTVAALVLCALPLWALPLWAAEPGAPIGAAELLARIEAGDAPPILDVRTREEFRAGHIPGAINVPLQELDQRIGELAALREGELVVHCERGPRAQYADRILRARGFVDPRPLTGHMSAWRAAARPVTPAGCVRC